MSEPNILKKIEDKFHESPQAKIDSSSAQEVLKHPLISGFLSELSTYAHKLLNEVYTLTIQTVVVDVSDSEKNNNVVLTITGSLLKESNGTNANSLPDVIKGKTTSVYSTTIELNGNIQNVFPANVDPVIMARHNALVDQTWKSKMEIIEKSIEGISSIIKLAGAL